MIVLYLNIHRLGQPEELLPLIRPYFLIQLVSLPFVCWFNTFRQFTDGITDTKVAMWILVAGNMMNIFGNWILIYGHLGLPEMGLVGAGLSTMISRIVMAFIMVGIFFFSKKYKEYKKGWNLGQVKYADFKQITVLGIPLALRISNFMGQRDYLAVRRTATAGIHLVFLLAILTSVPIFICRHIIGGLFTDNVNVISMVSMTIIPFMIYQFGDGLQCNYANAMRGTANVRPLIWIAFVSFFIVSLPLGYLFGVVMNYQLVGVWFAFPFGLTLSGVLYYIYYQKGLNKIESGAKI